ncbi:hypothetical protein V2J09_008409 [Rumex salicifolius]
MRDLGALIFQPHIVQASPPTANLSSGHVVLIRDSTIFVVFKGSLQFQISVQIDRCLVEYKPSSISDLTLSPTLTVENENFLFDERNDLGEWIYTALSGQNASDDITVSTIQEARYASNACPEFMKSLMD